MVGRASHVWLVLVWWITLNLKFINLITKISNNEKISAEELDELKKLQKEFEEHISTRTLTNKKDKDLFISTEKL